MVGSEACFGLKRAVPPLGFPDSPNVVDWQLFYGPVLFLLAGRADIPCHTGPSRSAERCRQVACTDSTALEAGLAFPAQSEGAVEASIALVPGYVSGMESGLVVQSPGPGWVHKGVPRTAGLLVDVPFPWGSGSVGFRFPVARGRCLPTGDAEEAWVESIPL